jgi:hypothetical protein
VRFSLPTSILLASVIVALGLYFGLRTPTAGVTPPPATADPAAAARSPLREPATAAPPQPPPVPTANETDVHVTAVVASAHARWKAACWDTADPATRKAGRYVAALAFDASGKLTVSGVGEERDASDSSVAQCLRQQVNTFTIPAPGHPVSYDVPFTMP